MYAAVASEVIRSDEGRNVREPARVGREAALGRAGAGPAVKPWELLGETRTPKGETMALTRHGNEYVILVGGRTLMSSRMHGSEEALATFGCAHARTLEAPCCLVGGLGMGFTLRAALDLLPPDARVVVAELVPALVDWNRGPLGTLAGRPLGDRRVAVEVGDVADDTARQPRPVRRRAARRGQWAVGPHRLAQCQPLR